MSAVGAHSLSFSFSRKSSISSSKSIQRNPGALKAGIPFGGLPLTLLRRQGNSKAEVVRTLKTYVSRRSTFPFFFFFSKIVHFLIEIDRVLRQYGNRQTWESLRDRGRILLEKFVTEQLPRIGTIKAAEQDFQLNILDLPFVEIIDPVTESGGLGANIGTLCQAIHGRQGQVGVRRILGVLSLAKKFGAAVVDDACSAALEMGVHEYHFVRRYLERQPQLPLSLHQVDPLIRELVQYRDLIHQRTKEQEHNEPD